jgi:hypothetical protein
MQASAAVHSASAFAAHAAACGSRGVVGSSGAQASDARGDVSASPAGRPEDDAQPKVASAAKMAAAPTTKRPGVVQAMEADLLYGPVRSGMEPPMSEIRAGITCVNSKPYRPQLSQYVSLCCGSTRAW